MNHFYIFQDPQCQDDAPPLLGDYQSANLNSKSNATNSFNNPKPWETIIPVMMTLLPYVMVNSQAHHMIFRFLMNILI